MKHRITESIGVITPSAHLELPSQPEGRGDHDDDFDGNNNAKDEMLRPTTNTDTRDVEKEAIPN